MAHETSSFTPDQRQCVVGVDMGRLPSFSVCSLCGCDLRQTRDGDWLCRNRKCRQGHRSGDSWLHYLEFCSRRDAAVTRECPQFHTQGKDRC